MRQIRPALVMIVLLDRAHRPRLSARHDRHRPGSSFPHQANGSLIEKDGKVIGSELIGQNFTDAEYFHGRPSATTDTDPNDATKTVPAPYNAANSSGRNVGPTSKALIERVQGDVDKLKAENPARRCRSTWSPPRRAASIPTSRRPPRCSRCRASPRRAACRRTRCAQLVAAAHRRPLARPARRAARQRAAAQPRARRSAERGDIARAADGRTLRTRRARRPTRCSKAAQQEGRGQLKIFLGAAPGVGKTYEMLPAARRRKARGRRRRGRRGRDPRPRARPRRCSPGSRSCRAGRSTTRAARSRRWISTPSWRAGRSWCWSTSSPTPTRRAAATPSATRTSRSCSAPASTSTRRSTSSTSRA